MHTCASIACLASASDATMTSSGVSSSCRLAALCSFSRSHTSSCSFASHRRLLFSSIALSWFILALLAVTSSCTHKHGSKSRALAE